MAKTIFNMADGILTPCNVACGSGIVKVNSPGGSTLQYGRWLWDDMPLNSPKRPPYWISTSGIDFDHITAVDMSFCTSLRNFIQIRPTSAKKWRHVDFKDGGSHPSWIIGSSKSPCTTFYRSSIETIALNCLVFEKIAFFCILATDRQTNKQTDRQTNRWTAPMH